MLDGKIYGRGTIDSKGQMAMMFAAIEAIQKSGVELKGRLVMACMPDGEFGGSGWRYMADSGWADQTDYIIGSEATYWVDRDQFQVCLAHYGQTFFEITTIGKPTHYWRPQREGVDAIWEMEKVIHALGELEFTHEPWKWFQPRLNLVGVETEAHGFSVKCKLTGCVFVVPGMTLKSIRQDIKRALDEVKKQDGKLDYEMLVWPRWYPTEVKEDSRAVKSLLEATKAVTGKAAFTGVFELVHCGPPAIFARANPGQLFGKPEVITFGAGDFRLAHIENEYCEVKNMQDSAQIYARVALDLVG
jgi:succinyl-diaminopimelate desuccinylase